jgi:hypothetical protein
MEGKSTAWCQRASHDRAQNNGSLTNLQLLLEACYIITLDFLFKIIIWLLFVVIFPLSWVYSSPYYLLPLILITTIVIPVVSLYLMILERKQSLNCSDSISLVDLSVKSLLHIILSSSSSFPLNASSYPSRTITRVRRDWSDPWWTPLTNPLLHPLTQASHLCKMLQALQAHSRGQPSLERPIHATTYGRGGSSSPSVRPRVSIHSHFTTRVILFSQHLFDFK